MVVDVYKLVKGEAERAAEIRSIPEGIVIAAGNEKTEAFLKKFQCRTASGEFVTYEAGEAWLEVLPMNLFGTRMWAEARNEPNPSGNGAAALHEASVMAGADVPFDEKAHPRSPKSGRWIKKGGVDLGIDLDFDSSPSVTTGPKSKIFLDPYHSSVERAASPRFKPLPKPKDQAAAREKVPGQPDVVLGSEAAKDVQGLAPGEEKRFPEGVLVTAGPGDTHRVEVGGTPVRPEDVPGSPELKAKFEDYDRRWAEASKRLGLDVSHSDQQGFWDGEEEASVATRAEAEPAQIEAAAALIGKHFHQDAMAVFTYDDDGPGGRFAVKIPAGVDRSKLAEKIKAGMPEGQGASVDGDEAYFYASDWAEGEKWAEGLAEEMDSDWTEERGNFTLLSDESYGDRTYSEALDKAPEARALDQEWADEASGSADARSEGSPGGSPADVQGLAPRESSYRVDGPDGTFWRVAPADVGELVEFEETTARANRYGAQIPGNPMVPLKGVDVKSEDPVGDAVGGTYHGGYSILPRGTIIHRKPGDAGDTFEVTSPLGTRVEIPATDKPAIIEAAKEMEKKAEGRLGGDVNAGENFKPTTEAADPDSPLQPLPEGFRDTRVAMHAQSERVLGYEHGGNEVALIRTEGGFGTPWYEDTDGKQTRWRIDGTDVVVEKQDDAGNVTEVARDPIGPTVDAASAKQLADFFEVADKMQRVVREEGKRPDGEVTDRRFDAPIIWPEHLDMAIELSAPTKDDPNSRVTVGASPGDEGHPEPYFYVAPWDFKGGRSKQWNAVGFNGAQLDYADVLASDDPERTIREFYERYMKAVGAWLSTSDSTLSKPKTESFHEASVYAGVEVFDPKQPRGPDGRWIDGPGGSGLLDKLTHLSSFDDLSDDDVSALGSHLENLFGPELLDRSGYDQTDPPIGDRFLAKLAADRGFDGKPELVDEVPDGPRLLARGLKPRGLDPEPWAEQFRSGQLFEGTGIQGHGTYVARGEGAQEDAAWYATKGGVVMRMEPKDKLNSVSLPDLYKMMGSVKRALDRGDLSDRQKKALKKACEDLGRLATLLGYDEIEPVKSSQRVLLNRSAVRVQRDSVRVTWESRAEPVIQPGPRNA